MANDNEKSTPDSDSHMITAQCSVCTKAFPNVQDCLKHELLTHSLQKRQPKSAFKNILNSTTKFLNTPEKKEERAQLHARLEKCQNGQELRTIFELLCMKTDSLDLIFTRIQTCMEKDLRSAGAVNIYPFGSIASGLALRDCDIDIFLDASKMNISPKHQRSVKSEGRQFQQRQAFNRISSLLHRSPHFTDVFSIRGARVPIIKCKHRDTGFSIDINVSCPSSKENTQFIYELVKSDERIHELLLFLKLWAKHMQIIGKANMSSYCLITMVIFFLQQIPLQKEGDGDDYNILKPVVKLQEHCTPHMVQGINYAFKLRFKDKQTKIPPSIQTWNLIKEFFKFYENYNFEDNIISTFYGKSVAKTDLTPDLFPEYHKQLKTITQFLEGEPAGELQINRCMCVQDSFCLNHNVAKGMLPPHKQYFIFCLRNANKICENSQNLKLSQLYEQLLYETINVNDPTQSSEADTSTNCILNLDNIELLKPDLNVVNIENPKNLIYTITASKADLRTLASLDLDLTNLDVLLQSWCQHYIAAIKSFITDIYRMDLQILSPTQQKQQKLDNDLNNVPLNLNQCFHITTSVDLWSYRFFQKSSPFMEYQLEQTERLHKLRRQDPKYSVIFNAILTLNILPKFMGIEIKFELPDGSPASDLNKKSPLRKFFNMFKNTLQNYNLKDNLKSKDDKKSAVNNNILTLELNNSDNDAIKLNNEKSNPITNIEHNITTQTIKKIKLNN